MLRTIHFIIFYLLTLIPCVSNGQTSDGIQTALPTTPIERPMIWVRASDRDAILNSIHTHTEAKKLYDAFKARTDALLRHTTTERQSYLSAIPLEKNKTNKLIFTYLDTPLNDKKRQYGEQLALMLQEGIDCGVMFYLTQDSKYAECAADVLSFFIARLDAMETKPANNPRDNNIGILYPLEHLKESRTIGAQLPIIYDFVFSYITAGGKSYDLETGQLKAFDIPAAQRVFERYIEAALKSGIVNCNWPVLESPSLVNNILALNDVKKRNYYLPFYLTQETPNQDSLKKVAIQFKHSGDIWPESLSYAHHVTEFTVYLMAVLDQAFPNLALGKTYPNIIDSVSANYFLRFPNQEVPSFGDGPRRLDVDYIGYERALRVARLNGNTEQEARFRQLILEGITSKAYDQSELLPRDKSVKPYFEPLNLLWFMAHTNEQAKTSHALNVAPPALSRTNHLPHAGLYLQRNVPTQNSAENGLMAVVSGAHYVHGHASGMNLELYGLGHVLGVEGGRSSYTTDIHENYYRLFAAHNTVVSNGASASQGGWVNLGIEPVQLKAMEPLPNQTAVSPDFSFTRTSFNDKYNLVAPAEHERHVAVIRTSESSGYYLDIFRARSATEGQYHDYIYHNVGDSVELLSKQKPVALHAEPTRFSASEKLPWERNASFRHPGWHFFSDVKTSPESAAPHHAIFTALALNSAQGKKPDSKNLPIHMNMIMPGGANKTYSIVSAPPALSASEPYDKKRIPTLVIRQKGDAWQTPFVQVFEPVKGDISTAAVKQVENLYQQGRFSGVVVTSIINNKTIKDFILTLDDNNAHYHDKKLQLSFEGRFAIIRADHKNRPISLYIGDGKNLRVGTQQITLTDHKTSGFLQITHP